MASDGKYKYTKKKTINKEFTVNANAKLNIDNSFGNVDIVTWNENRIVIEVSIETHGNSEEKTQKRLDAIDVNFSATQSLVSAKTIFNKNGKKNWFGNNNNTSMEINYTIKMPVSNSLDLSNDYGAININRLEGHAKISCDYGQLIIGELMADDNMISFDYTSKSTIGYMKSGKINADYSGFTLDKTERLNLNADYTNSTISEVNEINYNSDYGKITIEKAGTVVGIGDYISHHIGTVSKSININADYGSIKIDRLTATVNNVIIKSDYTGIKVGYDSGLSFDFIIDLQYASLKGEGELTVQQRNERNSSKKLSGFHGSQNSGNTININSEYGGLTLTKK
jgi:hypothetical protein